MNSAFGINGKSPFPSNDGASTSNQTKTPNCEDVERSTSPVLSNTKKSVMRMAKYRSRKKLLGKFTSSQDSVASSSFGDSAASSSFGDSAASSSSFTESDSLAPLSPVLLNSQVSDDLVNNTKIIEQNVADNDVKARFKRVKELQQQKKFHYEAVPKSSVNKPGTKQPDNSLIINNENCDNGVVCVGFKMASDKNIYISEEKIQIYTDLLNEAIVEENAPFLEDLQNNSPPKSNTSNSFSTNETTAINFKKQQTQSNSPLRSNNSKKLDVTQTQITDTQMIQAAENAETMLEVVDNQWTPDNQISANIENSQNFNISSIDLDSQWDVSPTKTQSTNLQVTSNSEEKPENLNISCLENVDTQWFSEDKETETSSEMGSSQCGTVSVISSQDFTLRLTEEEDNASSSSSSPKRRENTDLKTFYGILSFSTDGSTSLRQCTQNESNMQLRVKSDSWIFDVSYVNEETLGFNSKYWQFYAKKFHSYVESFENHIFPKKSVEAEPNAPKQITKTKRTRNKVVKNTKPTVAQNKPILKHTYNLRENNKSFAKSRKIVNLQENDEVIFKVPIGVPIRTTPKSSNKPKDKVDYNSLEENLHKICGSPLNESIYKNTSPSSNEYKTNSDIVELLQKEFESNYYIPNTNSRQETENITKMKNSRNESVLVSIQLKNISDFGPINQAITKRNDDFLVKVKQVEPDVTNCHMKVKLNELKERINLKFTQDKDYIINAEKQNEKQSKNVFAFKTASGKKSEVSEKSLDKIRNDSVNIISEIDTNNVCPEDLDALDFNSPIEEEFEKTFEFTQNESKIASMNEEDFIQNVDKIMEEIEVKDCSTTENFATDSGCGTCSVDSSKEQSNLKEPNSDNEEKLMDVDLSSPIQKEFMEEFNATCDFVSETDNLKTIQQPGFATASGGFESISEKSLEEIKRQHTSSTDSVVILGNNGPYILEKSPVDIEKEREFMKQLNLDFVGKNNEKLLNITKRRRSITNKDSVFVYDFVKKQKIIEVGPRSTKKHLNLFEGSTEEALPQIEIEEDPRFRFVSRKKCTTIPTLSICIKEKPLLDELNNISKVSVEEVMLTDKLDETIKNKFDSKTTNISNDLGNDHKPSVSEKKIQILDETTGISLVYENKSSCVENESGSSLSKKENELPAKLDKISESFHEGVSPLIELNENRGFKFVSGKIPIIRSTNMFNDIFENEIKTVKSKKEKQFIDMFKSTSKSSPDEALPLNELNLNSEFNFVSENKTTTTKSRNKFNVEPSSSKLKEKQLLGLENITEELLPPIKIDENKGSCFVSTKRSAIKSTNIFKDILENENKAEEQFIEELENISDDSKVEKKLPQTEIEDNRGFSFASGKKPIIKSTNIFKDIFENDTKAAKSKKEKQFLEGLKNIPIDSTKKQLPQTEIEDNRSFIFASGKKPIIKPTNIFKDIFEDDSKAAKSKKEEQFLEGLKNMPIDSTKKQLAQIEIADNRGFSFVSEKKPTIKPANIFKDIFEDDAKAVKSKKEEQFLEGLKNMPIDSTEKQLPPTERADNRSFSFVSGKKPTIKPTNIFKDIFENDSKAAKSKKEEQFLEGLRNMSEGSSEEHLPQVEITKKPANTTNIFENGTKASKSKKQEQFLDEVENMSEEHLSQVKITDNPGFSFGSGKKPASKSTDIFKDLFESESKYSKSTKEKELLAVISTRESNEEILVLKDKPEENNNKNTVIHSYSSPILGMKRSFNSPQIAGNSSTPISNRKKLGSSCRKRNLGSVAKSCRQLNLSENSAKKAKLIFEDFDVQPQDPVNFNNNNNKISIATTSKHITSTPVNEETNANTSLLNTSISMKQTNETLNSQKTITPTKANTSLEKHIPSLYSFYEGETDVKQKSLLEKKYELLKLEMAVFETRIQMIDQQEAIIKYSSPSHRSQRTGCLLCQKTKNTNKLALKNVGTLQKVTFEKALNAGVDKSLLDLTPQNALNFQFFVPWWTNDNRTYPAIIHTEDGAILIPNDQNSIGIHEIEQGFLAMPGVDPKLVPENWIRNHYKWIVWKLGSYERNFPAKFKGTMTVENIVAQLKYRYDREIDLAQRSALRRILEVDDSPAKRMVLCVSNIFKSHSHQNELELTDGWYSIKTLVDPILNNLINTNKIHIGLKLMIHGAELLNCEGCPPLETPANVRLQIHFNGTRRAAWYCKLGYQRNPGPLSVHLHSVRNQGGPVGLTTVYIARVYPVCFMEHGEKIIWRDRKAERRRANEWEVIQKNIVEKYLEETKNELNAERNERIKNRRKQNRISTKDICKLQDACSIYELWEECNDPESLTELLTEEQCHILSNYQMQQKAEEQAELAARLRRKLDEKNVNNRSVSSVLKMLVVDVGSLYHYRILSVWRPNEMHLQELREGQCVDFYNLTVKDARNLSSSPRTCFTLNSNIDKSKFDKFKRKVVPINELTNKQLFDEFDTVGFVVEINNEEDNKYMWIADKNKKFLLIRIRSTFQVVSILDGIRPGNVVGVQNLVHQKPTQNYANAMANCYSNLFIQPHERYLQYSMLQFIRNLPENKEEYLEDCVILVNTFKSENILKMNQLSTSMMYENMHKNNSVGFESDVLTVSDEEMSLIDTQYF